MNEGLQKIKAAAEGLLYISESDYPFELVHLKATSVALEQHLIRLSNHTIDAKVEQVTLEHFFRNMVKIYPDASSEQEMMALKYKNLQDVLLHELQVVTVYRVGEVQFDAFIIGKLPDGSYGGLRTKVVET